MTKQLNISVDSGFTFTKFIALVDGVVYRDTFLTHSIDVTNLDDDGDELVLDGKRYLIDQNTKTGAESVTSKADNRYMVATMTAIYKALQLAKIESCTVNVDLAINVPISEWKIKSLKQERQAMYTVDNAKLSKDGQDYIINLKPTLYYEGFGMRHEFADRIEKGSFACVELGSKNVTTAYFDENGKHIADACSSINLGCEDLVKEIQERLGLYLGSEPIKGDVRLMLKGQHHLNGNIEVGNILEEFALKHLKHVKTELSLKGISLNVCKIAFGGGGAELLKMYIPTVFHEKGKGFSKEPHYANCIAGMAKIGITGGI